jgi:hypothetical protein
MQWAPVDGKWTSSGAAVQQQRLLAALLSGGTGGSSSSSAVLVTIAPSASITGSTGFWWRWRRQHLQQQQQNGPGDGIAKCIHLLRPGYNMSLSPMFEATTGEAGSAPCACLFVEAVYTLLAAR